MLCPSKNWVLGFVSMMTMGSHWMMPMIATATDSLTQSTVSPVILPQEPPDEVVPEPPKVIPSEDQTIPASVLLNTTSQELPAVPASKFPSIPTSITTPQPADHSVPIVSPEPTAITPPAAATRANIPTVITTPTAATETSTPTVSVTPAVSKSAMPRATVTPAAPETEPLTIVDKIAVKSADSISPIDLGQPTETTTRKSSGTDTSPPSPKPTEVKPSSSSVEVKPAAIADHRSVANYSKREDSNPILTTVGYLFFGALIYITIVYGGSSSSDSSDSRSSSSSDSSTSDTASYSYDDSYSYFSSSSDDYSSSSSFDSSSSDSSSSDSSSSDSY
jgi:hypothetical protein